jgi:hypothetical protein
MMNPWSVRGEQKTTGVREARDSKVSENKLQNVPIRPSMLLSASLEWCQVDCRGRVGALRSIGHEMEYLPQSMLAL